MTSSLHKMSTTPFLLCVAPSPHAQYHRKCREFVNTTPVCNLKDRTERPSWKVHWLSENAVGML